MLCGLQEHYILLICTIKGGSIYQLHLLKECFNLQ